MLRLERIIDMKELKQLINEAREVEIDAMQEDVSWSLDLSEIELLDNSIKLKDFINDDIKIVVNEITQIENTDNIQCLINSKSNNVELMFTIKKRGK